MTKIIDDCIVPQEIRSEYPSVTTETGRDKIGVTVPAYVHDAAQKTSRGISTEVADYATRLGVDEATAHRIGVHVATTIGLKYFINTIDAGYSIRVLEERAGLEPIPDPLSAFRQREQDVLSVEAVE
jgi:hypothetical protein